MPTFKTRQEIANEYGIDRKTLYRWLKKENIKIPRGLINPKLQSKIYNVLGKPNKGEDYNNKPRG